MTTPMDPTEIPAERVAAARATLAAWMTARSPLPDRHFEPTDFEGYTVSRLEEWLMFTPPARANSAYLVSGDTAYFFAPSRETTETALEKARALARETT